MLLQKNSHNTFVRGDLWKTADFFRSWVCSELRLMTENDQNKLKGDYLFVIDCEPRFIVLIDNLGVWSLIISQLNPLQYKMDEGCPFDMKESVLKNIVEGSFRSKIETNSNTLQKLLSGRLKARVAFVTGQVEIKGDLGAFLKMVSLLKQSGVRL